MREEQTLDEAMDDLRVAVGRLCFDLVRDMLKVVFLPVRFFLWLGGD